MKDAKLLVICISNDSLYSDIWTNKQHLMSLLANNFPFAKIWYIDQGFSRRYIVKAIKELNFRFFFFPVRRWKKNLFNVSPYFLPLLGKGFLQTISWKIVSLLINLISNAYPGYRKVLWIYQPVAGQILTSKNLAGFKILYDCVDDFKTQPFYSNSKTRTQHLVDQENILINRADVVSTTSKALYERINLYKKNSYYVHNVGDFDHFFNYSGAIEEKHQHLFNSKQSIVSYAGVIDDYKLDLNLIFDTVKCLPDFRFVFLGPVRIKNKELLEKFNSIENIFSMGIISYQKLPAYLKKSQIIWLPYDSNSHTKYVFPIKLFESLATGKYVISRKLESINEYEELFPTFNTSEEAIIRIRQFKDDSVDNKANRLNIARKNTWDSRLDRILEILELK